MDRDGVYDATDRAARRLHREVNRTVMSVQRWTMPQESAEPFVRELRSRPLVQLNPPDAETAHEES